MNEFLSQLLGPQPETQLFHPLDVLVIMGLTMFLLLVVARSYQHTHRGTSYAQSYVHSLFLMGLTTGIVMVIIGSNVARAFSLVGALSIIRFRTAVKDVRDTAYLFFAIVVGMGCGTGFFMHTALFTLVTAGFMWVLFRTDFAARSNTEEILKVTFERSAAEAPAAIDAFLKANFAEHRLINSIRSFEGEEDTHVFVVRTQTGRDADSSSLGLEDVEGVNQVALFVHDQQVML